MPNVERLKMIQSIIDRLGRESANIKTWSVALAGGLLLLARLSKNPHNAWLGLPALAILGALDGYYLGLERAYRRLYTQATTDADWIWALGLDDLKTEGGVRRARGKRKRQAPLAEGIREPTVWMFHLALILAVAVAGLFTFSPR